MLNKCRRRSSDSYRDVHCVGVATCAKHGKPPCSALAQSRRGVVGLTDTFTCKSTSLIYCIICSKCSKMYVGQTSKSLLNRFGHHRSAAKEKRKSTWPIYRHFSSRGLRFETYSRILPLEHCLPNQLLSREIHWIWALNKVLPFGLNSQYSIT